MNHECPPIPIDESQLPNPTGWEILILEPNASIEEATYVLRTITAAFSSAQSGALDNKPAETSEI